MYRIAVMLFCCLVFTAPRLGAEILFEENFESGVLDSTEWVRYVFTYGREGKEYAGGFETRPEHVHSGERSYRLIAVETGGNYSGSNICHFFQPGVDKAYFRWYAKFAEDFNQGNQMHWCMITATRTDNRESAFGTAGQRPNGTDFAITHLEPSNHWGQYTHPGAMGFYTYFPEMKISEDSGLYYGNRFEPEEPFVIERGRWYCFEAMVKLNEPGEHDGEQAYWIDGKKQLHQRGIRWRDSKVLMLNLLQLSLWIHHAEQQNNCWFDDVVISTEYIGPVSVCGPPGGDYDGNGQSGILDVIQLIRLCLIEQTDPAADYNRDGCYNVRDVLSLLIDIVSGKCQEDGLIPSG